MPHFTEKQTILAYESLITLASFRENLSSAGKVLSNTITLSIHTAMSDKDAKSVTYRAHLILVSPTGGGNVLV